MITTSANEIVKPVHPDRMPVILTPDKYEQWLTGEPSDAQELLRPYPADQMEVFKSGEMKNQTRRGRVTLRQLVHFKGGYMVTKVPLRH